MARSARARQQTAFRLSPGLLVIILAGLTIGGCYLSRTIDQATAEDLNNRRFAFPNGAVFHAALVNVATTLVFTDNASTFTLSSAGGNATGSTRFDSCILTVATSTYNASAGPQVGNVITLDPCDFDSDTMRLTVRNRGITVTSDPATPVDPEAGDVGNEATASEVNNHSFTFANGAVFHSALTNIATALAFMDNATDFTLSSSAGTARGTSTFNPCRLTVTSSTYLLGGGPQEDTIITLNPCTFENNTMTLTVSNGTTTATSAPGTLIVP